MGKENIRMSEEYDDTAWLGAGYAEDFDAVVLANGDFPVHPIALRVLHSARYLICCDAAAEGVLDRTGKMPDAVVGDGDSLPQAIKVSLGDTYHEFEEQDYNDLTKATRFFTLLSQEAGYQNIPLRSHDKPLRMAYLGATGKREDHTLGNISLLSFYKESFGINPVMFTDNGVFTAHNGDDTITTVAGQQISIFNIGCRKMSSEGLRWAARPFEEWWMGTLNEALSNSMTIHADGRYLVFRKYM